MHTRHMHATRPDMAKSFSGEQRIKGKIGVPRLNGAKMGVLATRSPHRPAPIGLSVAQVTGGGGVRGGSLGAYGMWGRHSLVCVSSVLR